MHQRGTTVVALLATLLVGVTSACSGDYESLDAPATATVPPTDSTTTPATAAPTTEPPATTAPPRLDVYGLVSFYEMVAPDQLTRPFSSGPGDRWVIMRLSDTYDWNSGVEPPFQISGDGPWYLVGERDGAIWPVAAFTPPNDIGSAYPLDQVTVEVIGDGETDYPFVVFTWCCPMDGDAPRNEAMVAVARVIDGELIEITTGEPLEFASPAFWPDSITADAVTLYDGRTSTTWQVDPEDPRVMRRS